jgi:putative DNA primase/helicase
MQLDIAIGASRTQKQWKNKKFTWDELLEKFRHTHRTAETYSEYTKADKARQSEIKDIGGFVGGYLIGGTRKPDTVKHRQLLCLDIDFANDYIWDDFTMFYTCNAALYSTHKHNPREPRYRLIIPLSRPVGYEEYEAIGRKIAEGLDMTCFDSTGFQPERLMYWPSTSKDGEYVFEEQQGEYLDPDTVLDKYVDWKDVSEWPLCDNEKDIIKLGLKKQEDPTLKAGHIGAFCRAYPIQEAIEEFIPDTYVPAANGRYTYTGGTTEAGAVVYDDLYLYSHHSTDPCSGKLCNAFDLVRIHKFGHLDKDVHLSGPPTSAPSYIEMMDQLIGDKAVIRELGIFNDLPDGDWLEELEYEKGGKILKQTIDNILLILRNDPNLEGNFGYNEFDYRDYVLGPLPWNQVEGKRFFTDKDDAGLRHYLESKYNLFHEKKTRDAVDIVLTGNSFHPVRDYLSKLEWDGHPRIETYFIDALGAADTPYIRAVTRKALIAAVARIFSPGIKYDYVLTLVGEQGLGKSRSLRALGKLWYSDSLGNIQNKEAYEQIQGVWILEMGELAGLRKAEVENVKHFITKQDDKYRVAYGRRVSTFLRQCIFFGTTNEVSFLRDTTGNRRFWPIAVTRKFREGLIDIDQLWAEAKEYYEAGETLYLTEKLEEQAKIVQKNHAEADSWIGLIEKYLDTDIPEDWAKLSSYERRSYLSSEDFGDNKDIVKVRREKVCVAEIWCEVVGAQLKDMTNNNTKAYHSILQNMEGWERSDNKKFPIYGYQRSYIRTNNDGEKRREEIKGKDTKGA